MAAKRKTKKKQTKSQRTAGKKEVTPEKQLAKKRAALKKAKVKTRGGGLANVAPRHKTQRRRGGSPARDQSRIWQVIGMVTHGRGIGPFEICTESRV